MTAAWRKLNVGEYVENQMGLLGALPWRGISSMEPSWVVGEGDNARVFSNVVQAFTAGCRVSGAMKAESHYGPGSLMRDVLHLKMHEMALDIGYAIATGRYKSDPLCMAGMEQMARKWDPSVYGKAQFVVGFLEMPCLTEDPDATDGAMILRAKCTLLIEQQATSEPKEDPAP